MKHGLMGFDRNWLTCPASQDELSLERLRARADFGSGVGGVPRARDAVITTSGRSGLGSAEGVGLAGALLPAAR